MRRTPIACCLKEGGEYLAWKPRYAGRAPIRIYADGKVEDDIFAASSKWWTKRKRPYTLSRFGLKLIRRYIEGKVIDGCRVRMINRAA